MCTKIEIESQGGIGAKIFINGKEIEGVREVRYRKTGGELPVLELDFVANNIEINEVCMPKHPEVYKGFYELKKPSESNG